MKPPAEAAGMPPARRRRRTGRPAGAPEDPGASTVRRGRRIGARIRTTSRFENCVARALFAMSASRSALSDQWLTGSDPPARGWSRRPVLLPDGNGSIASAPSGRRPARPACHPNITSCQPSARDCYRPTSCGPQGWSSSSWWRVRSGGAQGARNVPQPPRLVRAPAPLSSPASFR